MERSRLLLLFALLIPVTAHAQVSVYANLTAQHVDSSSKTLTNTAGSLSDGLWLFGPQIGLYYDLGHAGPLHIGLDARGSILSRGDAKLNNGMAGLQGSFQSKALPIRPFLQASAGIAGFNYGRRQALTNSLQYEVSAGVDMTLAPRFDWRLVEIGGGGLTSIGPGATGGNGMFRISSGLSVRF